MAAKQLPEYKEWENLVSQHWDHWQYYLDLYSYSIQKPARSLLTSYLYPGFYQERLLSRDFAAAMQAVGEVKEQEITEYTKLTGDFAARRTFHYHADGPLRPSMYWNPFGALLGLFTTLLAARVRKPKVWYFVPGTLLYLGTIGLENRFHMVRIGAAIDLAQWTAERRKASIWLSEKNIKPAGIFPVHHLEQQFISLIQDIKA